MSTLRRLGCRLGPAALGLGLVALAALAGAQESFRVTYNVDRSNPARTQVTGVVFNDARVDVLDVYVTVEAVDGARKVVARGITFVSPAIPQGGNAAFDSTVPAPPTTASFRVRVSSFRFGLGSLQSP
jgi:hypothetical protein